MPLRGNTRVSNAFSNREFGDFQTPLDLAKLVCARLRADGFTPSSVLEPTCGKGVFLRAAIEEFGRDLPIRGIEIQPEYDDQLAAIANDFGNVQVFRDDIFSTNITSARLGLLEGALILGNPPWVTNSELSAIGSANVPSKTNLRKLRGIDAVTGASNFDIAEAIIYRLVSQLGSLKPAVALLCKTQVARNVLLENYRRHLGMSQINIFRINAARWFGVNVDACLLSFRIADSQEDFASFFAALEDLEPVERWIVNNHRLQKVGANYDAGTHVDGVSQIEWRQGVKHDASAIMELAIDGPRLVNRLGETIDVEDAWVFPLLKSSDVANGRMEARKAVLITQKHPGDDTRKLRDKAPRLWSYLERHRDVFEGRGSSIYQNKAPFSIFGIGPYSFVPFKVAISGLYHAPRFEVIEPVGGKPVMLDDTCYFAPAGSISRAAALYVLLSCEDVISFLRSVTFRGAKRPITKKVLQRIDLVSVRNGRDRAYWAGRVRAAIESRDWSTRPDSDAVLREILGLRDPEDQLFLPTG